MPQDRARVVVTGLGLVTPLGNNVESNWDALVSGRSGIGPITKFDASALPARIAGEVRDFDPGQWFELKEVKKVDPFCQFAVAAADMAIADARLTVTGDDAEDMGVIIGAAMGGIATVEESLAAFLKGGVKKVSPFFIPRLIANIAAGQVAIRHGFLGANYCTTSACASGAHAVGEGFRLIRDGYQKAVVVGGAEGGVTPMTVAGFAAMRALSTRNDDPARACRPFDGERDGLVVAEGAGILVLEDLARAEARGARVYGEVVGYGANADAYHITTPAPDGAGAARCMKLALRDASVSPGDIDYINAHGTSTPYNDVSETRAIRTVFGDQATQLAISSTKSMTGHTLGAAGGIEAAYTVLSLARGVVPPTINYETPDPECDLEYTPNQARRVDMRVALSNSFGFGGANACLVFRRFDGGVK